MNEYQQRDFDKKVALVKELNSFDSGYKFALEENKEPERNEIFITGLIPIVVSQNDYRNEYSFFLRHKLLYIRYETEKKLKETIPEPNNVHKLHQNKIKAWCDYLIKVYEELLKISKTRVQAVEEFKTQVLSLGGTIGKADFYGTFEGSIVKNGIEFTYKVHDEGYISKKIDIYYAVQDDFVSFIKLSNNDYR